MEQLREFIRSKGYDFDPAQLDGEFHNLEENNFKGWYVGETNGPYVNFTFCDWRQGEKHSYSQGMDQLSAKDQKEFLKKQKKQREDFEREQLRMWDEQAKLAATLWPSFRQEGVSEYMKLKRIGSLLGARLAPSPWGLDLIIPMEDASGKLWGFQKIEGKGQEKNGEGSKGPMLGGQKVSGLFFTFGTKRAGPIYICEGWATGASIFEALKRDAHVVVAFATSNLLPVAKSLREKYPTSPIVFCADNDQYGEENSGVKAAQAAASTVWGSVVAPTFKDTTRKPTDWNDLQLQEGITEVTRQLGGAELKTPAQEILTAQEGETPKKKSKKVLEFFIVQDLLAKSEGRLLAQNEDLFFYDEGYWKHLDIREINILKQKLMQAFDGEVKSGAIDSAFKTLLVHCPQATKNMFDTNPFAINFNNGTLHLTRSSNGSYVFTFKDHDSKDYLITKIPLNYSDKIPDNTEFLEMLGRYFKGPGATEKIQSVQEMFGACLCPIFPRIFLLYGPPKSGKSTIIKLAAKLLSPENISNLEPGLMHGFLVESMVGKLANIVTDIDPRLKISDALLKRIEDQMPIMVNRKGRKVIQALLPAVHIFGANEIPETNDGSGAHERRWTFIEFKDFKAGEDADRAFAHDVWGRGPEGILGFALGGLKRLCDNRGKYSNSGEAQKAVAEWVHGANHLNVFIEEIRGSEVHAWTQTKKQGTDSAQLGVVKFANGSTKIERKKLYEIYGKWCDDSGVPLAQRMQRNTFYQRILGKCTLSVKITDGVRYIEGIGVFVDDACQI